ncbi:MAG: isopentenyl phosphate kinase [Methanocorpusculum sp.]|nr:isopentenyl phosphate kinase [Methanocorpusculum sp.]
MSEIKIIKLGGSAVTDKSKEGVVNYEKISLMAKAVSANSSDAEFIIVHGAGSCGHPQAKKWKIQEGVTRENSDGIFETHEAVNRLNSAVVSALRKEGVNAVSFHPFECSFAKNGRLVFCGVEQIKKLISVGAVPVLHGDVVMDESRGACIVSGDQIAPFLAEALGVKEIGIATEVGGVLSNGKIVPEITRENVSEIKFEDAQTADVTGGMRGKIEELLLLADAGISSHIFAPEQTAEYLSGKYKGGTKVK